jgi:methyl-accepting chemotaxis protein
LFSAKGDIIYTVFKERDFATNVLNGQWKDTDIANTFRAVRDNPKPDFVAFFDFKPYAPSNDVPAAFIAAPILDGDGTFLGAVAFQMPIDRINAILTPEKGLGETGEIYLVGSDLLMRTNSRFSKESTILKTKVDTGSVLESLEGETHYDQNTNYRGKNVIVGHGPLDFNGVRYALVAEIEKDEMLADYYYMQWMNILVGLGCVVIITILSTIYARTLSTPINRMVAAMKELAGGNNQASIPYIERLDEIGDIAKAVQVFKENAMAMEVMQDEQEKLKVKAEQDKVETMNNLADTFDSRTRDLIASLLQSAQTMTDTAQTMRKASDETARSSTSVASAATEADSNVQTVAAAAEELAASSGEIARQISDVARRASSASSEAQETSRSVQELNELADSIGEVVNAIKDIADQTNLLALNATIEAARAGAAGKGFAVVADEVKKLATETGQKTEEIDARVGRIQTAIRASVEAMNRIIENVQQIDSATASVASAVEEQNAATSEIGRNVTQATAGTSQVSQSITQVQQTANQTGEAAGDVLSMASELKTISDALNDQIQDFLREIRNDNEKKPSASGKPDLRIAAE